MLNIEENVEELKFLVKSLSSLANYDNENITSDCLNFCMIAGEKLETISRILEKK